MPEEQNQEHELREKETPVKIIINGGNNQILPNATHATQNFYGVMPGAPFAADGAGAADGTAMQAQMPPEALSALRQYINDYVVFDRYLRRLATCRRARELAVVIVDMVGDFDVKVDQEEMVKQRFLEIALPLAPKVSSSISNLRQQVNIVWAKRKRKKV